MLAVLAFHVYPSVFLDSPVSHSEVSLGTSSSFTQGESDPWSKAAPSLEFMEGVCICPASSGNQSHRPGLSLFWTTPCCSVSLSLLPARFVQLLGKG